MTEKMFYLKKFFNEADCWMAAPITDDKWLFFSIHKIALSTMQLANFGNSDSTSAQRLTESHMGLP